MSDRERSERRPGVVVVGTGFGCLTHVRALRNAGFEVRALVGRHRARTAARAQRWEVPLALTSLEEGLALEDVVAVTVATPPHTHGPIVHAVVEAGKHVLCEKPFARDSAEAQGMLDAARAAGVVHLLGTEFRWATGQALATRAIARGAIGEPKLAMLVLTIPLLADEESAVPDWWSDREQGGGWLGAHAVHGIDQLRSTLGEFEGVSAGLMSVVERDWTAEDSYVVHFRMRSGVEGMMLSSAADRGPIVMSTRFIGTTGTLWVEGDTVKVSDRSGVRALEVPSDLRHEAPQPPPADLLVTAYDLLHSTGIDLAPYTALARTFRQLIAGVEVPSDPRPATFADGLAATEVVDAIRRSAQNQRWESVPT